MGIERGQQVEVVTASGATTTMRALGGPVMGKDFLVLWVCTEDAWEAGQQDGDYDGIPWPMDAVGVPEPV